MQLIYVIRLYIEVLVYNVYRNSYTFYKFIFEVIYARGVYRSKTFPQKCCTCDFHVSGSYTMIPHNISRMGGGGGTFRFAHISEYHILCVYIVFNK